MKVRSIIYLILGPLLIVLNLLGLPDIPQFIDELKRLDTAEAIGSVMGAFLFMAIGFILIISGIRLRKKIRLKKEKELEDSFLKD